MSYKQSERNRAILSQLPFENDYLDGLSIFGEGRYAYCIVGIDDKERSNTLLGVLCGEIQFFREIAPNEYCQELREIIERGYFDISYCDGVFTRRITVPKDWKPAVMTYVDSYPEITQTIQPEGHNTRAFKRKWKC